MPDPKTHDQGVTARDNSNLARDHLANERTFLAWGKMVPGTISLRGERKRVRCPFRPPSSLELACFPHAG
jgi:hypothetical protein